AGRGGGPRLVDPGERREDGGVAGPVSGDQLGPGGCVHQADCRDTASTRTRRAIASIATRPLFGSAATWTVERAGGGSGMKRAYTSLTAAKSAMSARKI